MADDNATIQQMREQISTLNKRVKELEPLETEVTGYRQATAMRELGLDPDSKQGKALLKLHDGDITADALRETAESYGITATLTDGDEGAADSPLPQETQDRIQAQRTINDVRSQATPVAGQKMTFDDFKTLAANDGPAATAAWQSGQVEVPGHVASQLTANRPTTPIGR